MSQLAIFVLGTFQVLLNGTEITRFDSDKARALLVYLAVESNRPHRRDTLTSLFWPDLPEMDARHNLRKTLHRLRQAIGDDQSTPPFLLITRQTIQFNPNSDYWLDLQAFGDALQAATQPSDSVDKLCQAISLYRGDFLSQSYLVNSLEFEAWTLSQRTSLHSQLLTALERLAAHAMQWHDYAQAEQYARRLVELDPLGETHQRRLMQVLVQSGQRNAALAQYETCRHLLLTELGVEPEAATTDLYIRLQSWDEGDSARDLPLPPCPYPGMLPFSEADQSRFFGREREIDALRNQVQQAPLQAIIGPSGSGKSSLVFAGLIPALRSGNGEQHGWEVRVMRPGATPQTTLSTLLPHSIPVAQRLLLVIDQFEELFTIGRSEAEPFQQALLSLAETPGCHIVLTIRADFYPDLMTSPLWSMIQAQRVEVAPLSGEELRQAIICPATTVGVEVEPALVERLVSDAANAPGVLPLMQETLVLLWNELEQQVDPWGRTTLALTLSAYQALGKDGRSGLQVALARHADAALDALDQTQQSIARRVFLRLIQFGEGQADTRRQQLVTALSATGDAPEQFDCTLQHLTKWRLLTLSGAPSISPSDPPYAIYPPSSQMVDLAHEALITSWPTLHSWVMERREAEQMRRRLESRAAEWVQAGRGQRRLLDDIELVEAERWLASHEGDELGTTTDLVALVCTSRTALEVAEQQREAVQREREALLEARAEAERQRAETQTAASRRLRQRAIWLAEALGVALVAAVLAAMFGVQAHQRAAEAQGLALATAAQESFGRGQYDEALALGLAAVRAEHPAHQSQRILAQIAYAPGTHRLGQGHTAPVNSVAISQDGRLVASAGEDTTIRLWDAETGQELQRLTGHTAPVWGLAFSPDGRTLASSAGDWNDSAETTIRLWDLASGEEIHRFTGHTALVSRVAFSPDGHMLLSSSNDETVRLWDIASGAEVQRFPGHTDGAWAITFHPNGKHILTGAEDATIRLWDIASGRELRRFLGHRAAITALSVVPDHHYVLSASWDGTLRLWHPQSGETIQIFQGHTEPIWAMALSQDGRYALSASVDRTVRLWDVASGQEVQRFEGHQDAVRGVSWHPNEQQFVSGSGDTTLRWWSRSHGAELQRLEGHHDAVLTVAFSPDGRTILSGAEDATLRLWDAASGKELRQFTGHTQDIHAISFSPNGRWVLSGSGDNTLRLWDVASGDELYRFDHARTVSSVAFSPDGRLALSGSWDATLRLWDLTSGRELRQFALPDATDPIESVAFSPNGQTILSGSRDNARIQLWDVATGTPLQQFVGHDSQVQAVAFSPDGQKILSGSGDGSVRLWDVASGRELRRFMGHTGGVKAVAFSPDGQLVVSSAAGGTVRLWDVGQGRELRRFVGHGDSVEAVAFSPDGHTVLSGSADMTVRLWRIDTPNELLTWIEHNRYVKSFVGFDEYIRAQ